MSVDSSTLAPTVVPFQYNPHTLTRSFEVQGAAGGLEFGQLTGPPKETIQVELVLDSTDAQETGGGEDGVAPQLAALLALVTPTSSDVLAELELAASGSIEILPPAGPITLFVWGPKRVLPVSVTEMSITEEAHDANLNPTLARVSLGLLVISYADVSSAHPAHALSFAGQVARELLAEDVVSDSLDGVLGSNVPLL